MPREFQHLLWLVNSFLALVSVLTLGSLLIGSWFRRKVFLQEEGRKAQLRGQIHQAGTLIRQGVRDESVLASIALPGWLEIARRPGDFIPDAFEDEIKGFLRQSSLTDQVEKLVARRGNRWDRIDGLLFLGFIGSPRAFERIKQHLDAGDSEVRYYAMLAMARLRTEEAVGALFEALREGPVSGQKVLSLIDSIQGLDSSHLMRFVKDTSPTLRFWALKFMSTLREAPPELQPVLAGLSDDSADVRAAACECLGRWKTEGAKPLIMELAGDPAWFVRMRAVRALGEFESGGDEGLMVDILCRDESVYVKESAKQILVRRASEALGPLLRCMRDGDEATRRICVELLVETRQIPLILSEVFREEVSGSSEADELFEMLVKSGIFFGLKREIELFSPLMRQRALARIRRLDEKLADQLSQGEKPS